MPPARWPTPVVRTGGRQSKFPQLEMKQDLQVKVQGSIGEKVKVDVDQTSNAAARGSSSADGAAGNDAPATASTPRG